MHEFFETILQAADLLKLLFFGANFEKSFPYAAAIVIVAIFISLHLRGYDIRWLKLKLTGFSVSTAIYFINVIAFAPLIYVSVNAIQSGYDKLGLPQLDPAMWQAAPTWLLVIATILAVDFADYWAHRLLHKSWLWPVHAIHHSETEMTGLTTYRIHFLESIVMGVAYVVLLTWLGLPGDVLGFWAILIMLHNVYVHMDMDWGHGPFRLLLASPRYHRWHHADVPTAHSKNLANVFPLYDVIFGTYYMPGTCTERLGAKGVPENDVAKLLLHPFKEWYKMMPIKIGNFGKPNEVDGQGEEKPSSQPTS